LRVPRRAILLPQDPRRVPRDSAMNQIFAGTGAFRVARLRHAADRHAIGAPAAIESAAESAYSYKAVRGVHALISHLPIFFRPPELHSAMQRVFRRKRTGLPAQADAAGYRGHE
ncbi:hypothetical protein, partial [Burkholderia thailandensis]